VDRQLGEAKKTLVWQQEETDYKLAGEHRYYENLLAQHETERPSARTASRSTVRYDIKLPSR
jgi:hypothetical protein